MTTIHNVRYGALLSPENLTGEALAVLVFSSLQGDVEERTVEEGDTIVGVTIALDGDELPDLFPVLYDVADGALHISSLQPQVGDLIVTTCSQDDVRHQAGAIAVISEDGTLMPAQYGLVAGAIEMLSGGGGSPTLPQTNAVTPMADQSPVVITDGDGIVHISADTSAGDVEIVLPSAAIIREISVRNRNGNGVVEVIYGEETLAVIHSTALTHATFKSFGGGWDVFD